MGFFVRIKGFPISIWILYIYIYYLNLSLPKICCLCPTRSMAHAYARMQEIQKNIDVRAFMYGCKLENRSCVFPSVWRRNSRQLTQTSRSFKGSFVLHEFTCIDFVYFQTGSIQFIPLICRRRYFCIYFFIVFFRIFCYETLNFASAAL